MQKNLNNCANAQELIDRLYHYYYETREVIPLAMNALKGMDYASFGACVMRSQQNAETHLKNQIEETSYLVREAYGLGAIASSAFGGGYGGSVWALVEKAKSDEFKNAWQANYAHTYPELNESAHFFLDHTGPAASELTILNVSRGQILTIPNTAALIVITVKMAGIVFPYMINPVAKQRAVYSYTSQYNPQDFKW